MAMMNADHVIITSGRTGSLLLSAILNMHPRCVNRGEILGEMRNLFLNEIFWKHPDYLIKNFWLKDYSGVISKGFKFLYFQDLKRDGKISELVKENNYKVLHLKRRNRLKKYISWKKVYENQGKWGDNYLINDGENPWLKNKVEVDVDDLLDRFRIDEEQEEIYDEKFPNALEIYYEDMVLDFDINFTNENNKTIQKCFEYLGLDYQELITNKKDVNSFLKETDFLALESYDLENYTGKIEDGWFDIDNNKDFILKKTRILPLDECISNYDEVKEKLYGTEYDKYLEETMDRKLFDSQMKDKLYNIFENNNFNIDILKLNKVYLRGGAIMRLFMGIPLTDADLDFYFLDLKYFKEVDDYFNNHYEFSDETPLTKTYKCGELELQLIRHPYLIGTYEYTTSMTDFTITLGSFHFETESFVYPNRYLYDIESKELRIHRLEIEPPEGRSWANALERIEKYGKLGFTASDDVVETIKRNSELKDNDEFHQRTVKMSWLRNKDLTPIVPNIDVFVNWLMDIKEHEYFDKFNYYIFGGFISWPEKTKDIDLLITKRDGQYATLKELEELMVDMFDSAYDYHKFFLDTFYMRTPQWIADYPRNEERLRSVEKTGLWITITKNKPEYPIKFRRYGKLNCCYRPSFTNWYDNDSDMINRWVALDANYTRMVDLRRIIKYYENNKERNIEDFLDEFQEYSGY
jgi:hypothetical protein